MTIPSEFRILAAHSCLNYKTVSEDLKSTNDKFVNSARIHL
jgi:hypothetical protein